MRTPSRRRSTPSAFAGRHPIIRTTQKPYAHTRTSKRERQTKSIPTWQRIDRETPLRTATINRHAEAALEDERGLVAREGYAQQGSEPLLRFRRIQVSRVVRDIFVELAGGALVVVGTRTLGDRYFLRIQVFVRDLGEQVID